MSVAQTREEHTMFNRFFGKPDTTAKPTPPAAVTVTEAQRQLTGREAVLIDVRERDEWAAGHVAGATHIPLADLPTRLDEVPRDQPILLFCRSGNRSGKATAFLRQQGYTQAANVEGGIIAWQGAGLPVTRGN
jgi:rhodanese-related sulfurtransferase